VIAVIFGLRARRQRSGFFRRNAEPVHAGVDLQRGAALPVVGGDEGVPLASSVMLLMTGRALSSTKAGILPACSH